MTRRACEAVGQLDAGEEFDDVLCLGADNRRPCRIDRIKAQHEAIILDRRAAARGGDDDRIDPGIGPVMHIAPGPPDGIRLLAHMMGERAATGFASGNHHFVTQPRQKADGGGIDGRFDDALHAAHEQRHAAALFAFCRIGAGRAQIFRRDWCFGNQRQHGLNPLEAQLGNHL